MKTKLGMSLINGHDLFHKPLGASPDKEYTIDQ